jgi:ParB family chromosome partitioning protein
MERRLGRGLDSLIPRGTTVPGKQVLDVPVEAVVANPDQPRKSFHEAGLETLAASIRVHGVVQPIVVQALAGGGYQLVAGERRLRASRLAGRATVPALVIEAGSGTKSLELALIENLQRENLGPLEEATAYEALLARASLTHQEVANRVGKSRAAITNTLRLLELPDGVKGLVNSGVLSAGQARALLAAPSDLERERLAVQAVRNHWTVREIEARAGVAAGAGKRGRSRRAPLKNASHYAEQLQILYGTRVHIREKNGRGELALEFYTAADRDRLVHRLLTGGAAADEQEVGRELPRHGTPGA